MIKPKIPKWAKLLTKYGLIGYLLISFISFEISALAIGASNYNTKKGVTINILLTFIWTFGLLLVLDIFGEHFLDFLFAGKSYTRSFVGLMLVIFSAITPFVGLPLRIAALSEVLSMDILWGLFYLIIHIVCLSIKNLIFQFFGTGIYRGLKILLNKSK